MFSIEFLHTIREHEIDSIRRHLPPGARILEIGGGTGYQAMLLSNRGYDVSTIDIVGSHYKEDRVFPVTEYDGRTFPFPKESFDVVFSSSVLEHLADAEAIHQESRRVLKPGGYCVHIMPSAVWRFWESVAFYEELLQRGAALMAALAPRRITRREWGRIKDVWREVLLLRGHILVPRHGERGNALTELWTFTRRYWLRHFRRHRFEVLFADGMGLFYTGRMIFGPRWTLASRARAAAVLGSACILYKVQPLP